jgi:restriction endonuclease Mrr
MLGATAGALVAWLDPAGLRAAGIAVLILVAAWGALRLALALRRFRRRHTLSALRELSPAAFERAVAAWLARDGWLVEHHGRSGDHGIDLLAFHGDELVAVQCKRYAESAAVTPAQVRELYGAAVAVGATRALLVTTGRIGPGGVAWRETLDGLVPTLEFLDGEALARFASGHASLHPAA